MLKHFSLLFLCFYLNSLIQCTRPPRSQSKDNLLINETSSLLGPAERDLALHLTQWSQGNETTQRLVEVIGDLKFDPTTVVEKKGINLADYLKQKSNSWPVKFAACAFTFGALITGSFVAVAYQYNDALQLIPGFVGVAVSIPALIKYGVNRYQVRQVLNAIKHKSRVTISNAV